MPSQRSVTDAVKAAVGLPATLGPQLAELAESVSLMGGLLTDLRNELHEVRYDLRGLSQQVEGLRADMEGLRAELDGTRDDIRALRTTLAETNVTMARIAGPVERVRKATTRRST